MKIAIKGQGYNFCIVADEIQFYIKAMHPASSRFSFINNLNAILSVLNIDVDDRKVSESQWLVSKKQSRFFFERATDFLSNKDSRDFIEKRLDEDRQSGEWENFQRV